VKDIAIVSTSVVTKQNGNEVVFHLKIIWHFMACKGLATNKDLSMVNET